MPAKLLPIVQSWTCHSCTQCCRAPFYVSVSDAERDRIAAQGWSDRPEFRDRPLFATSGPPWNRTTWLAQRPDGACVFLTPDGLCRIHAEFGATAKPESCRAYPLAVSQCGDEWRLSARFSCPSAAAARGTLISDRPDEFTWLADRLPADYGLPPPALYGHTYLSWNDLQRVCREFEFVLSDPQIPIGQRLLRGLALARLVRQIQFGRVPGEALDELFAILRGNVTTESAGWPNLPDPSSAGRLLFRQLASTYLFQRDGASAGRGVSARWRWFIASLRFARGRGLVPAVAQGFPTASFAELEQPEGELPPDAHGVLDRCFRVRLAAMRYFGHAHFGWSLLDGYFALAAVYPVLIWMMRWRRRGDDRPTHRDALLQALSIVDAAHDHLPYLGYRREQRRLRLLVSTGDLDRLIAWYSR